MLLIAVQAHHARQCRELETLLPADLDPEP
jgi:hypothetical protein